MKISENWLRSWVPDAPEGDALAERLTMAGLEVDAVDELRCDFTDVVVARIEAAEPHPESRKLQLCRVNAGEHGELPIICGAPNARPGLMTALAVPGARLPGGRDIGVATIAGVQSQGMLCSESELGIGEDGGGIMELPADLTPGRPLAGVLSLPDRRLEVDLTPNRGDCLGLRGLARDIAAITATGFRDLVAQPVEPACPDRFPVRLGAPERCPVYAGRVIRNVDCAAPTPLWMKERLAAAGVRSISAVVDITNYVMLELGQPMHAFDLARLEGGIDVRMAQPGERLTLLDGQEVDVTPQTLVIADHARAVALAGIMGGQDTGVTAATRDVFLESAFFTPAAVAGRARAYHLHTDASHRFERGVSFELQAEAAERATALITLICGGEAGPLDVHAEVNCLPVRRGVDLRRDQIARLLGFELEDDFVRSRLEALGMQVADRPAGWSVTVPAHRFDVAIEADLIEELARLTGYDNIPAELPALPAIIDAHLARESVEQRCRNHMIEQGYREVITYSFVDPSLHAHFGLNADDALVLANPISSEMSAMRLSMWPGLAQVVDHNAKRQQTRGRFFEIGRIFLPGPEGTREVDCVAGALFGEAQPMHWQGREPADFFTLKGDVQVLCAYLGLAAPAFVAAPVPGLHPGQAADIRCGDVTIGKMGKIHPLTAESLDLPAELYLFELQLSAAPADTHGSYVPVPRFPSVRRDISVVVDTQTPAATVIAVAEEAAGSLVADLQLFDLYAGEGIDSGKKSLALGLTFQASSSTLTDEEVDAVMVSILDALKDRLGAKLRN